ncbi:shikimate dehydrogenase [Sandarakinorhabdus sp.]|uniref:shikimate dehydrogenase n=1 Tax=Sandarakinorhabdus sp. TaxID=1916663 RepID=UPI00286DD8AE|nr:shikimate dehydrogenase [Sandarakinorhabdus sp.]
MTANPMAAVIGWPLDHSKSPLIHEFWLEKLGLEGGYRALPIPPETLRSFIMALSATGLVGVNVTIPHKVAVMDLVDTLDDSALAVGAVNTIKVFPDGRTGGANTDVDGICEPLAGHDLRGREVIILGSGGAARAAVTAAVVMGADWVTIVARDLDKGAALLRGAGQQGTVLQWGGPLPESPEVGLLFNATSLGMAGQPPLDIDLSVLPDDALVFDAVYVPLETPLLRAARVRGLGTIDGLSMLIGQAATAFEIFFGYAAPREHDAELRALLTR